MRAGALDRSITLRRLAETSSASGAVLATWQDVATVRAQLIEATTAEFMETAGVRAERLVAFRIRWLDGVENADRIACRGETFDIVAVKEIGRRRGLELRAKAVVT